MKITLSKKTTIEEEVDVTFPIYLKYENPDDWERYEILTRFHADGSYLELTAKKGFRSTCSYEIDSAEKGYPTQTVIARKLSEYIGNKNSDYSHTNNSHEFDELYAEILRFLLAQKEPPKD